MSEKDGGFAFPVPEFPDSEGMTLRDWFAGQALAGILAKYNQDYVPLMLNSRTELATESYALADAMLEERAKK